MKPRKCSIDLVYKGINISKDLSKDLLSFDYTDNASNNSDSISISLKDETKKWLNNWFPEKGDFMEPSVVTHNWNKYGEKEVLPCGIFVVDEPEYSGRPSTITLNGVASPLNKNFSDANKNKVWKNISIKSIASDIAKRYALNLRFISNKNPYYESIEQSDTPDSTFLSDACKEEGLAMKLTNEEIVIFDESEFEKRPPVATYSETNSKVLGYGFKTKLKDTNYAGVEVKYQDPKTGRLIEYLHTVSELDEDSKIYKVNKRVNNINEAVRLAQSTARRLNKVETTGSLTVMGNIELLGGATIKITDFGEFDGKYYIQKASHSFSSGYSTQLDVRRV